VLLPHCMYLHKVRDTVIVCAFTKNLYIYYILHLFMWAFFDILYLCCNNCGCCFIILSVVLLYKHFQTFYFFICILQRFILHSICSIHFFNPLVGCNEIFCAPPFSSSLNEILVKGTSCFCCGISVLNMW